MKLSSVPLGFTRHARRNIGGELARGTALRARWYRVALLALGAPFSPATDAAEPATEFHYIARLGLDDPAHTAGNGVQQTEIWRVSPGGVVAGMSTRFLGAAPSSDHGSTLWLADSSGETTVVGLPSGAPTGVQVTEFRDQNASGAVVGITRVGVDGQHAWIADLVSGTRQLGFTDAAHTLPSGVPHNVVIALNDHGAAVGSSLRADGGESAWLHTGTGEPLRIGLLDAAHTSPTGVQRSRPTGLNNAGVVVGVSTRYLEDGTEASTAWIRAADGSMTSFGEGPQYAGIYRLTNSGYFVRSTSYAGVGAAAVGHVEGGVRPVGLPLDPDAVYPSNSVAFLTEAGIAAGSYSSLELRGAITWVSSAEHGTQTVGLAGYGTGASGGRPYLVALNASGQTVGYSDWYLGITAAWLAEVTGESIRIGLYDDAHYGTPNESLGPFHLSVAEGLTDSGYAWGRSNRYNGDAVQDGQTAWVYHAPSGTLTAFDLSIRARDGYGLSYIAQVLEDGTVLGGFTQFNAAGANVGPRGFVWKPSMGTVVVQEAIDVAPNTAGWASFGGLEGGTLTGLVVGTGRPLDAITPSEGVWLAQRTIEPPPPAPGPEEPLEYIGRLGFHDARHTAANGHQFSDVRDLAGAFTMGYSQSFTGTALPGFTAWVGDGNAVTRRVGFYDALHTRSDGRQESFPVDLNNGGVTIGYSRRFSGAADRGQSAWVADRWGRTIKIGFYDAAHTARDGSKYSEPVALNRAHQLIGYSRNPDSQATSAWLANSVGSIKRIGLLDAPHGGTNGVSLPLHLNDAGYVTGMSEYHGGGFPRGYTTWLRLPGGFTREIGFQTGVHRSGNGGHDGQVLYLTESGYAAGFSWRYAPGDINPNGQTTWVTKFDGPNRPVGFYTGIHLAGNGIARSEILDLNELGYAAGFSSQFDEPGTAFDSIGSTAWIARPDGTTIRVGLYDAEHTFGGFSGNVATRINASDSAIGGAWRFGPGGYQLGSDAWVANAAGQTTRLGLTDALHTAADGYRGSAATHLTTSSRLVAGFTNRYNGGTTRIGQTAWIYDRVARTYVRIEPSVRATDLFAYSEITQLREDGTACGTYQAFAADGTDRGERAFVYLPGQGAFDLGNATASDLSAEGWAFLTRTRFANGEFITGVGARVVSGQPTPAYGHAQGVFLLK